MKKKDALTAMQADFTPSQKANILGKYRSKIARKWNKRRVRLQRIILKHGTLVSTNGVNSTINFLGTDYKFFNYEIELTPPSYCKIELKHLF